MRRRFRLQRENTVQPTLSAVRRHHEDDPDPSPAAENTHESARMLTMQQTLGNQAVQRYLHQQHAPAIQRDPPGEAAPVPATSTIPMGPPASAAPDATAAPATRPTLAAIQQELADLMAQKPKYTTLREYKDPSHADILKRIRSIRDQVDGLKAADVGLKEADWQATRTKIYLQLNEMSPYYAQMENLDILGKPGTDAWKRTCNVTVLAMALEAMGITAADFKGNTPAINTILSHFTKALEARKIATDTDATSLRLADFLQLVVIYFVMTGQEARIFQKEKKNKAGEVSVPAMTGQGMKGGDISALAKANPADFTKKVEYAQWVARNLIVRSGYFKEFSALFGVKGRSGSLSFDEALGNIGEWGRARMGVELREDKLAALKKELDTASPKEKAKLEKDIKSQEKRITSDKAELPKSSVDFAADKKAVEAQLSAEKDPKKQKKLRSQIDALTRKIAKAQGAIVPLADLQTQQTNLQTALEAAATKGEKKKLQSKLSKLEKELGKREAIPHAEEFREVTSEADVEAMVPLEEYKKEVTDTFQPMLGTGKQVEVNLHNHFVRLQSIGSEGVVVDDPGRADGEGLFLTWRRARLAGYFKHYVVYEKE